MNEQERAARTQSVRHLELRLILAARRFVEDTPPNALLSLGALRLRSAVEDLAAWHGSDTHLLADLDQELSGYFDAPDGVPPLADLIGRHFFEVGREWIKYGELEDGTRVRCKWFDDPEGLTMHAENTETGHEARFQITVTAEQLPALPPIGPENDLGVYGIAPEDEQEQEPLQWFTRTWADVRAGDVVRIPGTTHVAEVIGAVHMVPGRGWHVHPAANPYHPEEMPAEWLEVRVRLAGRADITSCDPAKPIEIQMTGAEVAAIEIMGGWGERLGLMTTETGAQNPIDN